MHGTGETPESFTSSTAGRQREILALVWAFETSNNTPPNSTQTFPRLWTRTQIYVPMKAIFIQATTDTHKKVVSMSQKQAKVCC